VKYLLDTHAILWAAEADPRLGRSAKRALEHCKTGEAVLSDISLLEIAMLVEKARIQLAGPIQSYLLEIKKYYPVLAIEPAIAAEAFQLPLPQADPFDRVIVATSRYHALPLITRDVAITQSGLVDVIW
jgi:PIN domain nuclease of toxin-antitoxin system